MESSHIKRDDVQQHARGAREFPRTFVAVPTVSFPRTGSGTLIARRMAPQVHRPAARRLGMGGATLPPPTLPRHPLVDRARPCPPMVSASRPSAGHGVDVGVGFGVAPGHPTSHLTAVCQVGSEAESFCEEELAALFGDSELDLIL